MNLQFNAHLHRGLSCPRFLCKMKRTNDVHICYILVFEERQDAMSLSEIFVHDILIDRSFWIRIIDIIEKWRLISFKLITFDLLNVFYKVLQIFI